MTPTAVSCLELQGGVGKTDTYQVPWLAQDSSGVGVGALEETITRDFFFFLITSFFLGIRTF